ncbi:MAG: glycoside hydrolase family 5 protein, partial [Thermoguttaceae bacterium]|nr:glycoside hydrolase family 5 protein [Thermoguttaceae bacterium]
TGELQVSSAPTKEDIPAVLTPADLEGRWSAERAWQWYEKVGSVRGVNYLPAYCVNTLELWQAATFQPKEIEKELQWAARVGLNSLRVFLHNLVWEADAAAANARLNMFLDIAWRNGLSTLLVLFDDCWNQFPKLGPQPDPIPGVHNSRWVASPGRDRVVDPSTWGGLENYVRSVVRAFAKDERVLGWDVYNEPGNSGLGEKSLPLLKAAVSWVRAEGPTQPLTVGLWANFSDDMHRVFAALSDIVSFHCYEPPAGFRAKMEQAKRFGRPVLCTEFLRRQVGNTFAHLLPLMFEHRVGWYFWGLVAGRSQTYLDWSSKPGDPPPAVWQHDLLRADGQPFEPAETALIGEYARRNW